jgi:transcriptional regulator with XRE-family HTH domain
MDIKLNDVHVGHIIRDRLKELKWSQSEFGRRTGIPQQHVKRVLDRETMETYKLAKVCRVLDINIFARFCDFYASSNNVGSINADHAAVSVGGGNAINQIIEDNQSDVNTNVDDSAVPSEVEESISNILDNSESIIKSLSKGLNDARKLEQLNTLRAIIESQRKEIQHLNRETRLCMDQIQQIKDQLEDKTEIIRLSKLQKDNPTPMI